jgi:hypothetical protein
VRSRGSDAAPAPRLIPAETEHQQRTNIAIWYNKRGHFSFIQRAAYSSIALGLLIYANWRESQRTKKWYSSQLAVALALGASSSIVKTVRRVKPANAVPTSKRVLPCDQQKCFYSVTTRSSLVARGRAPLCGI